MSDVQSLLTKLKSLSNSQDASAVILQLKKAVLQLNLLLIKPSDLDTKAANRAALIEKVVLARDAYETITLFCARSGDVAGFERSYVQLKPYYTDLLSYIPDSKDRLSVTAVYLLSLIASQPSRLAEFHSEIEQLSNQDRTSTVLAGVIQLERSVMEGAYHKAMTLKTSLSSIPAADKFFVRLAQSFKHKIADCIQAAYSIYPLADLSKAIDVKGDELNKFVAERQWVIVDGQVLLDSEASQTQGLSNSDVVEKLLSVTSQLERIV